MDGIGPKRRKRIKDAWAEQKVIRQIMVFLHCNGVSTSRAVRIYKTYGEDAIEKVQANPYALAKDIHGIGFKTADQIAQKIGIPVDSLIRACAGLSHVLIEATGDGHCALPVELLKDEAGKLLLVDDKIVTEALERTLASSDLVKETINGQELIFLPHLKRAEEIIAARIRSLSGSPSAFPAIDFEKAVVWCQQKTGKELAPSQREALKLALTSRALGHHRRPRRGQDDARQRHPADPAGQEGALPAVCAHRQGRQTPLRGDRRRGQDNPPPARSPARHGQFYAK